jgi:hypothetical protein
VPSVTVAQLAQSSPRAATHKSFRIDINAPVDRPGAGVGGGERKVNT